MQKFYAPFGPLPFYHRFLLLFTMAFSFSIATQAQTLVWEENFEGTTINADFWSYEVGDGCAKGICGWGNAELQYYTNRPENARIEDGKLIIEARRENFQTRGFTSARLKTEGKVQFKYGTVEARIKVPDLQNGLWPALWTLGAVGGAWPANGEIDILEMGIRAAVEAGLTNRRVGAAVHWEHNNTRADHGGHYDNPTSLTDDYHTYKMVWTAQSITVYVDDHQYFSFNTSGGAASDLEEFHNPHFLLLNLAVGGNYTGITNGANITAPLPAKMYVDYIKLYQNQGAELYLSKDHVIGAGNFGVLTETTPTVARLNFDGDANLYIWENTLTPLENAGSPFEGTEGLAFRAAPGSWFGMGTDHSGKNLSAYLAEGSLKFHMKTTSNAAFKVGVKNGTTESWVMFPASGQQHGLVRDGNWHQVSIPLSAFQNPAVDFTNLTSTFMFAGDAPAANFDFQLDNIYYSTGSTFPSAPFVSLTSPEQNQVFTAPATVSLTADASDTDGTITKVEFYNGNALLSSDDSSPFAYSWTNVPAGMYAVTAKAYDNQGNTTVSSARIINVNASATTGNFGIFTETTSTSDALNYDGDANLYLWDGTLSPITEPAPTPQEGSEVIAVKVNNIGWFGFGIANSDKNLSGYAANGSLKFHMKTTADGTFKVGMKSGTVESWINFTPTGNQYGLTRDGNWHQVTIPLSAFMATTGFNLNNVNQSFMVASVSPPTAGSEFFFDNIYLSLDPLSATDELANNSSIKLYPNPTSSHLILESAEYLGGRNFEIVDVTGRKVLSGTWQNSPLQVSALAPGVYILVLENKGRAIRKRFVKK